MQGSARCARLCRWAMGTVGTKLETASSEEDEVYTMYPSRLVYQRDTYNSQLSSPQCHLANPKRNLLILWGKMAKRQAF